MIIGPTIFQNYQPYTSLIKKSTFCAYGTVMYRKRIQFLNDDFWRIKIEIQMDHNVEEHIEFFVSICVFDLTTD